MKVNLHTLACELAREDGKSKPAGYDANVIGAETTLKSLGRKLRDSNAEQAIAIVNAIVSRAGLRKR